MDEYLERKAARRDPSELAKRLAEISLDIVLLQSEKKRIEDTLENPLDIS